MQVDLDMQNIEYTTIVKLIPRASKKVNGDRTRARWECVDATRGHGLLPIERHPLRDRREATPLMERLGAEAILIGYSVRLDQSVRHHVLNLSAN
jgi:hypothetical protein